MKESAGKTPVKSKAVQVDMTPAWQKYANAVMIPIIIGLSVFLLVRFRMNSAAEAKNAEMGELSDLSMKISELRGQQFRRGEPLEMIAATRDQTYSDTQKRIDLLLETTKDPAIQAQALVIKGDLNWEIANYPALPGAATQPTLATPKPADDYLTVAESAYSSVIKDHVDQPTAVVSARLGLGAIDENRGKWDDATKDYQAVIADPNTAAAFVQVAQTRLDNLKTIRTPLYLGKAAAPVPAGAELLAPSAAAASTTTRPTTMPVMRSTPATMPSAPATQSSK